MVGRSNREVRKPTNQETKEEGKESTAQLDSDQKDLQRHLDIINRYLTVSCFGMCEENCMDVHPGQTKRRPPKRLKNGRWNYKPFLCKARKDCEFFPNCMFAHCAEEINYHPMVYKTKKCKYDDNFGVCLERGVFCHKAHGDLRKPSPYNNIIREDETFEEDLESQRRANIANKANYNTYNTYSQKKNLFTITTQASIQQKPKPVFSPLTFKTEKCENFYEHNQKVCLFYHSFVDRRRPPVEFGYRINPCSKTFDTSSKSFKSNDCPLEDECPFAHSFNEIYYHPEMYKLWPCKKQICDLGNLCPFVHEEKFDQFFAKDLERKEYRLRQKLKKLETLASEIKCNMCRKLPDISYICGHLSCRSCKQDSCPKCLKRGSVYLNP